MKKKAKKASADGVANHSLAHRVVELSRRLAAAEKKVGELGRITDLLVFSNDTPTKCRESEALEYRINSLQTLVALLQNRNKETKHALSSIDNSVSSVARRLDAIEKKPRWYQISEAKMHGKTMMVLCQTTLQAQRNVPP